MLGKLSAEVRATAESQETVNVSPLVLPKASVFATKHC